MHVRGLFRKVWTAVPLGLLLFVLWIVFTGSLEWTELLMGAVVVALLAGFSSYLLKGGLERGLDAHFAIRFPVFSALLFWEIIKANWDVIKRVLAPSLPISPRIISFETFLESDLAITILANSITLTPGTVTVEIEGREFFIHCLAGEHGEDLLGGRLERMTAWLTGEGQEQDRRLS